jgi:hypothetical protein
MHATATLLGLGLLALLALPAGCAPHMCEVTKVDEAKARPVKTIAVVPFKFEYEKWLVKPEKAKDKDEQKEMEDWNKSITETYGKLGRHVAEEIAKHIEGAAVVDQPPATGYYVHGILWKIVPGKKGLRIASWFVGGDLGAAFGQEGKVETRFTCWLKPAGSNDSIAAFEAGQEDEKAWSGGYEAVCEYLDTPIWHFCRRLQETCPDVKLKK